MIRPPRGPIRARAIAVQRLPILLLVTSLAVACGAPAPPAEPVRVGVLANPSEPLGAAVIRAAELAVDGANQRGGVEVAGARRQLELVPGYTGADPWEAVASARRLVHQEGVIVLIGPGASRDAIAVADVAENANVPMVSTASTHPLTTAGKRFAFRVAFTDTVQARALAQLARQLGIDSLAILYDVAEAYSRGLGEGFCRHFEAAGGRVVALETYATGETDWLDQIERLRAQRPQALFLPNHFSAVLAQVRQVRAAGLDVVLLGSDAWFPELMAGRPELEGAYFTQHWHPDLADLRPEAARFRDAYQAAWGEEPLEHAALTWDAVGLVLRALEGMDSAEPAALRDRLASIVDHPGATGDLTYLDQGGDPRKAVLVLRMEAGRAVLHEVVPPAP